MKTNQFPLAHLRSLAVVSCLTLMIGLQAFADSQLKQPTSVAPISPGGYDSNVMPAGCCPVSCCGGETASGRAVCCPKRVTTEIKRHCWKVKSELVCIPGFRFQCSWNKKSKSCDCGDDCCSSDSCSDCPPQCGRVRCIKVLEKHETTCEKCGCEWEVKCVRSGKGCCRSGGCDCPSCGVGGCCASTSTDVDLEGSDIQLISATESTSAAEKEKPSLARQLMPWLK